MKKNFFTDYYRKRRKMVCCLMPCFRYCYSR